MPSSDLISDLVVVLPGIMGSTLIKDGTPVWEPSAGSVLRAIATFGRSIRELTLPKDIGDDSPGDHVEARALMPDLHVLPGIWSANIGYEKLLNWLRANFHLIEAAPGNPSSIPNFLPFPYDWRLSNRYNARRLKEQVEPALERWRSQGPPFSDARIIFVCHSMGGLVARWYIEKEGGAAITRKLITLGTPFRGALNALDQLVNGVRKGIGPFKLELTDFARSLPSIHQLLPEYACIESATAPDGLAKTAELVIPKLDPDMVQNAMKFHNDLDEAARANTTYPYDLHPIVGFRQPTFVTARIVDDAVEGIDTILGNEEGGDGTVPRISATPQNLALGGPTAHFAAEQHGSLQSNQSVLNHVQGILSDRQRVYRATTASQIGVRNEPILLAGERLTVEARVDGERRPGLEVTIRDENGKLVTTASLREAGGVYRTSILMPKAGGYFVIVNGVNPSAVEPVTSNVLVWSGVTA